MTKVAARRLGPPRSAVRLVVLEDGADARSVPALGRPEDELVVIAQGREESPLDLVLRVIHRLSSLEQSRRHVASAVLRVAPRVDEQAAAARDLLARALLTHSAVAGSSELVFDASGSLDAAERTEILELVDRMFQEAVPGRCAIRVQFGEPRPASIPPEGSVAPESGVMPIARVSPLAGPVAATPRSTDDVFPARRARAKG
ncbi:MAG: hypothetical protein GX607_06330 [Myxococcales bacterium]|jgi:hypothetical protein|nr:hypothetical protein [Myxococcales bacterium]